MKIRKKSISTTQQVEGVRIAASSDYGTKFYAASLDQILNVLNNDEHSNVWVKYVLTKQGLSALDMKEHFYGSAVFGDTLYICKTDGKDILVDGKHINPEEAFDKYDPEDLTDYIEDASDEVISDSITHYELKFNDVDGIAKEMLDSGHSIVEMFNDALEIGILD